LDPGCRKPGLVLTWVGAARAFRPQRRTHAACTPTSRRTSMSALPRATLVARLRACRLLWRDEDQPTLNKRTRLHPRSDHRDHLRRQHQ
jgi:hypothetical protein